MNSYGPTITAEAIAFHSCSHMQSQNTSFSKKKFFFKEKRTFLRKSEL